MLRLGELRSRRPAGRSTILRSRTASRSGSPAARILLGGRLPVVGHAVKGHGASVHVEHGIAGRRVSIARLAGRAGDGEPPSPGRHRDGHAGNGLEGHRARPGQHEVEGLLVDVAAHHPGGVPAPGQRGRCGPRVGHVDVPLGRCRAAVHEVEGVAPEREGKRCQEGAVLGQQDPAGPADRPLGGRVHPLRGLLVQGGVVVVAADHHGPARGVLHHEVEHRVGVGAVPHQVPHEGVAVGALRTGVLEARRERFQVRMDVGEEGDLHDDRSATAGGHATTEGR